MNNWLKIPCGQTFVCILRARGKTMQTYKHNRGRICETVELYVERKKKKKK